jgi:hypothetical protein
MRFELIGRTKATLTDIDIQSLKKGQTDVVPAVALSLKVMLPNAKLAMLGKRLLGFFFEKASPGAAAQSTLDGVEVISEMPALTPEAEAIGPISWDEEQTGSKLVIYQGITGDADIRLKDGTVRVKKITPKEGGACEFIVSFYSADVDADTLGALGVLKSHELDIELVAAEIMKQPRQREIEGDHKVTPIKAGKGKADKLGTDADQAARQAAVLAKDPSQRPDWPFGEAPGGQLPEGSPEAALAATAGLP